MEELTNDQATGYAARAPVALTQARRYGGHLCLPGEGPEKCDLMVVMTSIFEEDTAESTQSYGGIEMKLKPKLGRAPAEQILFDLFSSEGIPNNSFFTTALCRWLLPRTERSKPKKESVNWGAPALMHEISRVQPKIIVACGKPAFDFLTGLKLAAKDIEGGWFKAKPEIGEDILVYPMLDLYKLISSPATIESFMVDVGQVAQEVHALAGRPTQKIPTDYRVARCFQDVCDFVDQLIRENRTILSVDCEWHGTNHVTGMLRSMQIGYDIGKAVYIRFMDDKLNYTMDADYRAVGKALARHLNRPDVKYVGHHISADFPWMHTWLGLDVYRKCILDTEYALQTLNEHQSLSLERIGMRYTDLGRYDQELMLWCKANKHVMGDGYGLIPDEILIPYACADVDVPFRIHGRLMVDMMRDNVYDYYTNIFHPFVTDVFTHFTLQGLPMDVNGMDDLRDLCNYAKGLMLVQLREDMLVDARKDMENRMLELGARDPEKTVEALESFVTNGDRQKALDFLKQKAGSKFIEILDCFEHFCEASMFNPGSADHKKRWLFKVKKYTPVKSTKNNEKGIPSISWEKVLTYPEERQREFNPAVDKQTLQILAQQHGDALLRSLLRYNAVSTLCKSFLREPIVDDEGNLTKEQGLHFFVAPSGRLHGQYSTTETGRPRAWKPNILNWPSYVHADVSTGILDALKRAHEKGQLQEQFLKFVVGEKPAKIPSIRSLVKAPPGWCVVDSDFQTAEVRGLGFLSGDSQLIDLVTKPDPQYGFVVVDGEEVPVRLLFAPQLEIPHSEYANVLFSLKDKVTGEWKPVDLGKLVTNEDGTLKRPKRDLHWALAEEYRHMPRECMDAKTQRNPAKVVRFSSTYGAAGTTLERKIESDTGVRPEPGSGDEMLEALKKSQQRAEEFLEELARAPEHPGYLVAASGRKRRAVLPSRRHGVSNRQYESALAAQGREFRNFPMQESVASTAARAGIDLLHFAHVTGLQGRPMVILYDAVSTLCPVEERRIWAKAHELFMNLANGWKYHGRVLTYPIDTDFVMRWSQSPKDLAPEEKAMLGDDSNLLSTERAQKIESWLDDMISRFSEDPEQAVTGRHVMHAGLENLSLSS